MKEKYKLVSEYFRHKATVDEFAGAFAYMNCITLKDHSNSPKYIDSTLPVYIITSSSNDGMQRGDIASWESIEQYMDDLIENGCDDDIACLYGYLIDKY
jgi:hypothetical protein